MHLVLESANLKMTEKYEIKTLESMSRFPVVGSIATMQTRKNTFSKVLPNILTQVDILYIYLDGYEKIPKILMDHPKCRAFLPNDANNLHGSNRFLAAHDFNKDAIMVFFDDDIFYPSNYVYTIKKALAKYGQHSVVGFHGSVFRPPHMSYVNDRISLHFTSALKNDTKVHLLGAGTAAYLSSVFRPDPRHWQHHNMADLYLGAEAINSNLSMMAIRREAKWLLPLEENQFDSIWRLTKNDDSIQTSLMCDILAQYANTKWKSWWKTPADVKKPSVNSHALTIDDEPSTSPLHKLIFAQKTDHFYIDEFLSNISKDKNYRQFTVGDRTRYATCSGVAWVTNTVFVTVNLYGQHLQVYQVKNEADQLVISPIYEIKQGIEYPESVAVSPDKKMMAISHTMSTTKGLSLHKIKADDGFEIDASKDIRKGTYHSLCFTPNSRFLAVTEIGKTGFVEIIDAGNGQTTYLQKSRLSPLRPKSVAIDPTGSLIIIISGSVVKPSNHDKSSISVISIHHFDQNTGVFEDAPMTDFEFSNGKHMSLEDACIVKTSPDGDRFNLICVDQANDKLHNFSINSQTLKIKYMGSVSDDVSFPHGIDVSPSGRFLAVANYGDNSIRILHI